MNRRSFAAVLFVGVLFTVAAVAARQPAQQPAKAPTGWQLPPEADSTRIPSRWTPSCSRPASPSSEDNARSATAPAARVMVPTPIRTRRKTWT